MSQPKRFAGIYVLTCAAALASSLTVNVLGNASGLFPSFLFPAGSDRAWKTRRLDDAARESRLPKAIILGSSRVMQIQPAYVQALTGKPTFNYGVATATSTDFLTQLRYLLGIGCRPELVLVGVDETVFRAGYSPWEMNTLAHAGLFAKMPFPENLDILAGCLREVDLGTTRRSLARLVKGKNRSNVRSVDDVAQILLDDGYLIYCNYVRDVENGTFDQAANIAKALRENDLPVLSDSILRPSPRRLGRFREFLSLARDEGIEVRVIFLPWQPDYARQRFPEPLLQARSALSRRLETISTEYGALYRDFSDLATYDGDPRQFYDPYHQTPANTQRMMNVLFGRRANDVVVKLPTDSDILKHLPPVTTLTTE